MLAYTNSNGAAAANTQFGPKTDDRSFVARAFAEALRSKAKGTGETRVAGGQSAPEGTRGTEGRAKHEKPNDSCCII
jgi:hypothetical protein